MNYKTIIIFSIFSFLIINLSFGKKKPDSIESYKKSKNVFVGKVIAIQELKNTLVSDDDYFNVKLAIEFEVKKIYKGRRHEKFIITEVIAIENKDYFALSNSYIIYADRIKSKAKFCYNSVRTRNVLHDNTEAEITEIENHVKKKIFRKAKNPIPRFKFATGGCNC